MAGMLMLDAGDGLISNKKLISELQNILLIREKWIYGLDDQD